LDCSQKRGGGNPKGQLKVQGMKKTGRGERSHKEEEKEEKRVKNPEKGEVQKRQKRDSHKKERKKRIKGEGLGQQERGGVKSTKGQSVTMGSPPKRKFKEGWKSPGGKGSSKVVRRRTEPDSIKKQGE